MSLQWRYERLDELGVLALAGRLESATIPRFFGALNWPLARGEGPLLLDLSVLAAWDAAAGAAIGTAARRLATGARRLELAAAPAGLSKLVATDRRAPIGIHPDLVCALRAHGVDATQMGQRRVWHTSGWPADEQAADRGTATPVL